MSIRVVERLTEQERVARVKALATGKQQESTKQQDSTKHLIFESLRGRRELIRVRSDRSLKADDTP